MAAGTTSPETSPARKGSADPSSSQVIAYDRYIETQLHRTRRQVKGVDLSTSMMLLVVAALVYLMLVALLDHWVVTGGLSVFGRLVAFAALAAGAVAFAVLKLVPLAMRRVNPVFAAYTIERHRPGLKNSLINFLLLRSGSDRLPDRIYQAMEVQAANALSSAHAEMAVDRTPLIRLLLALVAAVFFVAMYAVLSPKNPFTSFRRVMSPWSDVAPPTRVLIRDIQPGDANGFHDQHVAVSAQVDGVRPGESVTLRYSTVDAQVVARAVPMAKPNNGYRYAAELPADNLGLQQDLEYWIEAGDAFSPHHKIKVDTAPTIVVEEIAYQYPAYAEMPPRTVARRGDIQGLAGTRVTLRAKANQPIRQANLDFECDGRNDLDMQVDGTRATVSFSLAWSESLRRAEHESYQLRFRNQDGHENPKPIRYTIEVIRDLPPEVELVEPELDPSKELVVPAGRPVPFAVQAADPDFKLAAVKFQARRGRSSLVEESLLAEPRGGQFRREYLLDLKRLDVKPGEQIEFWASADDNRHPPVANHSETPHYRLRVASPDQQGQGRDDQNAQNPDQNRQSKPDDGQKKRSGKRDGNNQEGNEEGGEGQPQSDDQNKSGGKAKGDKKNERRKESGDESGDQESSGSGENGQRRQSDHPQAGDSSEKESGQGNSDSGEQREGQGGGKKAGESGDQSKRVDPERDAGKAIDEINKYFNEKNKENKGSEENRQGDKQPERQQSDDQKPDENKTGEKSAGKSGKDGNEQKEGSQEQGDQPQQGGQSGKRPKSAGEPKEKQSAPDQGENGDGKSNEEKPRAGQKQSGKQAGDQREAGDQQGEGDSQEHPSKAGKERKGTKPKPGSSKSGEKSQEAQGDKPQDDKQSEGTKQGEKKNSGDNGPLADKQNDQKGGPGEQAGAQEDGDQTQGEKPGAKGGKKPSAGKETPSGDKQGVANEGSDQSQKDETGDGKQGDAKEGDEQEKHADGETHARKGQGGQSKGAGELDDKVKKHEGESPDQKGGDPESQDKGQGGAGDSEGANKHGAPTRQGGDQQRNKKELTPDAKKGTSEDKPESPSSKSRRESDSQGAQDGDREGGGKSGGGQKSNSEGTGSAGQNSESDEGSGQGETRGKGPTGEKGGDQQKADKPTGGKPSGEKGAGSNQGQGQESKDGPKAESPETADPRGHNNASNQPGRPDKQKGEKQPPDGKRPPAPQNKEKKQTDGAPQSGAKNESVDGQPTPSDRGGYDVRGGRQRGNPTGGGEPGPEETTPPPEEPDNSEPGGEDPNQEYARKATDLALERLKDQLAKDKPDPDLLDKLKWSREDIDRFVQQWDRLKKAADETGPKGDAARQELDDALRSLGLRPRGSSVSGGQKRDDKLRNLREGRRAPPPPEYQEQYIEFNKARAKGTK